MEARRTVSIGVVVSALGAHLHAQPRGPVIVVTVGALGALAEGIGREAVGVLLGVARAGRGYGG